jgi:hypothetical protein
MLYRYWDAQRRDRAMPARRDVSPADVRELLPHLTLIDVEGDQFRYRLVGSRVVQDLGRDMTGTCVGSHVTPPEYARAICSIYARVCETRLPVFTTGEYRSPSRLTHAVSRLLVPLGEEGGGVSKILLSRVSRYDRNNSAAGWIGRSAGRVGDTVTVQSADDVVQLSLDWDRQSTVAEAPAA